MLVLVVVVVNKISLKIKNKQNFIYETPGKVSKMSN